MKLDVLLSNIHGYPRNGRFDAIPFIKLKGTYMKSKPTIAINDNN